MASVSLRSLYQPQTLEEIINDQYWESQLIITCLTKSSLKENKPTVADQLIRQFLQAKTNANLYTADIMNYIINTKCCSFLNQDVASLTFGLIDPSQYTVNNTGGIQKMRLILDLAILLQILTENQAYLILSKIQSRGFNVEYACYIFRELIQTIVDISQLSLYQRAQQLWKNFKEKKEIQLNKYDINCLRYIGIQLKDNNQFSNLTTIKLPYTRESFMETKIIFIKPKILKIQLEYGIIQMIEKRKITIWNGDINNKTINFINQINQQKDKLDLNLYPFFLDHIQKPYTDVVISQNHLILITQKLNLIRVDFTDYQIEKLQIPHYINNNYQSSIIKYLQQIHDAQLIYIDLIQMELLIKSIIINIIPFQFNNIELSFFIRTRGELPISDKLKNQFLLTSFQPQMNLINDQIIEDLNLKELKDYHNQLDQENNEWYQQIEQIQILEKGMTLQQFLEEDLNNRKIIREKLKEKLSTEQIISVLFGFSKEEINQQEKYFDYHEKEKEVIEQQPIITLIGEYLSQKQSYNEKLKQKYNINKEEIDKIRQKEIRKKEKFEKRNKEKKDDIIDDELIDEESEIKIEEPSQSTENDSEENPISENHQFKKYQIK